MSLKPFLWLRYLDEIFGIRTQNFQKLNELFNCINSLHPTFNFTRDYSTTEINFLGVTVTKVGNKLEEDHVQSKIERIKVVERTISFQIRDKKVDDSITLVLTYHLALNQFCEIL